jgi:hypothetical protein
MASAMRGFTLLQIVRDRHKETSTEGQIINSGLSANTFLIHYHINLLPFCPPDLDQFFDQISVDYLGRSSKAFLL